MNIFELKTDNELKSYFPDYQTLWSFDKYDGLKNQEFIEILNNYKNKYGPIGESILGHDFCEAIFHRWENASSND